MKKIQHEIVYIIFLSLFALMQMSGCKEENTCYQGRIEFLNSGNGSGCSNILRIEKTISGGLPANTTISFNPDSLNINVKEGDILDFTIVKYEEWNGFVNTMCTNPQYSAQIEICNP